MYLEKDLVLIGKRENNKKRNYLVVNKLQGKHIPVSPSRAFEMFDELAGILKEKYLNKKLLLIGFAETATAIGAEIAVKLNAEYIQTTREIIPDVSYLYFSEAHSHATEQKLVKEDMDAAVKNAQQIIFIEDEVTTGNTILNIVDILEKTYGNNLKFAVASLLNGMNEEHIKKYEKRGIELHYLVKIENENYGKIAEKYDSDGEYNLSNLEDTTEYKLYTFSGWIDARRIVKASEYNEHCMGLWKDIRRNINIKEGGNILVIGTEEFMYPALFIGANLEKMGCKVKSHSTTRSPIEVCKKDEYPVHVRYELRSLYDDERKTFIYDINSYDKVLVITDSHNNGKLGLKSLINALKRKNDDINIIIWK